VQVITSIAVMQRLARQWQRRGVRIGFVPTMGYLHEGHLSLVRAARRRVGKSGRVVVSIYVNPTQFAPGEDLAKYPRDLKRDLKLCHAAGVDVVFTPGDAEMYPQVGSSRCDDRTAQRAVPTTEFSTYIVEEKLSRVMEGASRPTHFRGVTTVVAKLFHLVLPDVAVFGQKDYQQAAIIRRMVADLNFQVNIIVAPTVREPDGLALSSRNQYLVGGLRRQATVLWLALQKARATVRKSARPIPSAHLKAGLKRFIRREPDAKPDYVEFFDPDTLMPVARVARGTHLALAVSVGTTRLIDNARL
jgi:pantoate--beta-alanine ligase